MPTKRTLAKVFELRSLPQRAERRQTIRPVPAGAEKALIVGVSSRRSLGFVIVRADARGRLGHGYDHASRRATFGDCARTRDPGSRLSELPRRSRRRRECHRSRVLSCKDRCGASADAGCSVSAKRISCKLSIRVVTRSLPSCVRFAAEIRICGPWWPCPSWAVEQIVPGYEVLGIAKAALEHSRKGACRRTRSRRCSRQWRFGRIDSDGLFSCPAGFS